MIAYMITNNVNGKRYIGITKRAAERWSVHKRAAISGRGYAINRAIAKYGIEVFSFETIACAKSWNDLVQLERILIDQHGTFCETGKGYNLTRGGDGTVGYRHKDAAKSVMREARLKRFITEETARKISAANKGQKRSKQFIESIKQITTNRWKNTAYREHMITICQSNARMQKGNKLSAVTRAKMSAAHKGKPHSPAHKAALAISRIGFTHSSESRAKISAATKARHALRRTRNVTSTI